MFGTELMIPTLLAAGTTDQLLKHLPWPALKNIAMFLATGRPALNMPMFKDKEPSTWWPQEVLFHHFTDRTKPELVMLMKTLLHYAKQKAALKADYKRVLYKHRQGKLIMSACEFQAPG